MDGLIVIDKGQEFTSHDVVAVLRGILKQKKIGHTGTLDPMATGVLPVCLGKATRLAEMLGGQTKEYIARLVFGCETDTEDIWGRVTQERAFDFCEEQFRKAVEHFIGTYPQVPPRYSAVHVDGKRLYDLARAGKEAAVPPRPVTIHAIEILEVSPEGASLRIECAKGTYVRALIRDIGRETGWLATMSELRRTKSGPFRIQNSYTLGDVEKLRDEGRLDEAVLSLDRMLESFPELTVLPEEDHLLANGNPLRTDREKISPDYQGNEEDYVRMRLSDGTLKALYRPDTSGPTDESGRLLLRPYRMF